MRAPYLSLVIPAYNEEDLIESSLRVVIEFLSKKNYSWEIVVVDDGSRDETVNIVKKMNEKRIKVVTLPRNVGKGGALKQGMLAAKGEYVVFSDADLSVPIEYLDAILRALKHSEVAIASRRVKGAHIKKHQPFARELMGIIFTKLTQVMMNSNIADFTCGFKGFQSGAAQRVFEKSKIARWAYDAEIIFLAQKYNFKIEQVPVTWENREESRVRVGKAAMESLRDLVRIRYFELMRKYEK